MKNSYAPFDLPAGTIVSVPYARVLRHYGVVTARGTVISNSRKGGGVIEQSFTGFANGNKVRTHNGASDDHPHVTEARARRKLGRSYDLTGSNCIDLTRHTHRRRPTPWQVGRATIMAVRDMFRGR